MTQPLAASAVRVESDGVFIMIRCKACGDSERGPCRKKPDEAPTNAGSDDPVELQSHRQAAPHTVVMPRIAGCLLAGKPHAYETNQLSDNIFDTVIDPPFRSAPILARREFCAAPRRTGGRFATPRSSSFRVIGL